ncbi:phenylalanine--tRNA ligase subunit beta [Roseicyclus sp. F158]|uniref:Phenylalanine--tRNA ligase beta subunit n=1 Tax=Tropicimonas omnivorans TaxID=3075590 RepID=A0ABU3DBP9_9RHOB|nr:phenylalanine--tRNA ligase subunit beta [Roseicyclus sp. F158]MDT0681144.1 phenylalanine--tRNA ligase subunit beta [Roseicyclus sp. F158]
MKFTLAWLKEHLDTAATLVEITFALSDLGLEVENVTDPAAALSSFSIGKVVASEKHPDADRLKVCRVETGSGETQIICGAPNAREGITVVVAAPGTYVPGIDTTIQVGKIRGIESHGMMCSERELELGEGHDGIIELPSGTAGQPFSDWLEQNDPGRTDPVIEIGITPNRPDALGVRGIARDLAARGLGTLKPAPVREVPGTFPSPVSVTIAEDARDVAPVFCGRLIRGVRNGPSPDWLQARLKAIGLRPISALVDITNFFTHDRARPLHVFDAGKLAGGLTVHPAQGGETMMGLDDKEYTFEPGMTVISDEAGIQSIGGVMGGLETGCTTETTDVFVESAWFDPVRTAFTGRALKINSDARYRFERGVDPASARDGLELATRMILDLCGGEASEAVIAGAAPDTTRAYPFDPGRVVSLVGMDIPEAEQRGTLEALGFRLEAGMAHPPSWRPDIQGSADLVEEVARIASLTKLEGKPMPRPRPGLPAPVLTPLQRRERTLRRTVAGAGYNECVSYSFVDQASAALFGGGGPETKLENPISSEMSHMRPALLPGLLQAAARNQARGQGELALFEIGAVFSGGEPEDQSLVASGILVGDATPRGVHGARRGVDLFDAKADLELALASIGAPAKAQIRRDAPGWFHPGRSGAICLGKTVLGVFGEFHPKALSALDVKGPAVGWTLSPGAVPYPRASGTGRPALRISGLQAVERDFAFVLDRQVAALDVVNAAGGADKALIESVRVFDEFTGEAAEAQMGEGKKSLAIAVRLQPMERTLTDEEIDAVSKKVIEKVTKATGGTLRG